MSTRIGVEDLVYAIMTTEGVYSSPVSIAPAMKVGLKPTISSETLYGDNTAQETISIVGDTKVELETTYLTLAVQAALLGRTLDAVTGIMGHSNDDIAPYVALGFRAKKANGTYRYVWLLKGKFDEPAEDFETVEDKVKFQTPKITAMFVTRLDGYFKYTADEEEGTVDETFLDAVHSPTLDLVAPTYTIVPVDDEDSASKTAAIVVSFDKPMDPTTVNAGTLFCNVDDGAEITLTGTWDATYEEISFAHAELTGATLHNIILTTGIKSSFGIALDTNDILSFTTVA